MPKLLTFFFLTLSSALLSGNSFHNSPYFEGKLVYKNTQLDNKGKERPATGVSKMEFYFKDHFYKHSVLEGSIFSMMDVGDIIVNTKDSSWYEVNTKNKIATKVRNNDNIRESYPKEVTYLHSQDSVLGYPCKKYKIVQRAYMDGEYKITYVWVSEDLKFMNLPTLARIFSYRSTRFLTGKLGSITLKTESYEQDGSLSLRTEAVEIKPIALENAFFEIPSHFIKN